MPGALPLGGGGIGAPDSLVDLLYPRCGPSAVLERGDVFVAPTDGFVEAKSPAGEQFGQDVRHDLSAARVAELGEAWLTHFETRELCAKLQQLGFAEIEDIGPREMAARYFPGTAKSIPEKGGHVLHATKI